VASTAQPSVETSPMLKAIKRASVAPKMLPMGLVKPGEVAALTGFLLSEHAASTTGQQIVVCDGASL
jgi:NAD(P)-dependent dehydrogenase (short-subunit alcohol dehydrogenase family)